MRRLFYVVFWLTLSATIAFLALSKYEVAEHLETQVIGSIETGDLSRLWYSPSGDLVGVTENEALLNVRIWKSDSSRQLIRESAIALPPTKAGVKPVYAVLADATKAAWVNPTGVHVQSLVPPMGDSAAAIPFKRKAAISALEFTGSGQILALYHDGELELWDPAGERVTASKHIDIADPATLLVSGPYVAAYSGASGNAFVFDAGSGDKLSLLEYTKYPREALSVTLSPQARFAAGTRETLELEGHTLAAPGPVRSLAYFDRNRVLAGGDFAGIYLLDISNGPQRVAAADPGTTLLAAAGSRLAFGNSHVLAIASDRLLRNRVYKGVSKPPTWLLITLLGLVTPVAIYFLYGSFGYILKKVLGLKPSEKHEPKPEEEEPIPNALIEACQNGDCVLWAGSGLAAQAGLPTWTAFLREMVEWAANGELAPAGMTGPALAELAEGKTGSAADKIAAAFENREQPLHAYLRRRFRVGMELPKAHRLIKEIDFPALISTHLDNLLERAFPQSGGRVYTAVKCGDLRYTAKRREFFLLKPFGDLDEPDTIRVGPGQCIAAIRNNPAIAEFVQELFETRVFLFIGASLEGIEKDLAHLIPPTPGTRKHYALVPTIGEGWMIVAERLRQRYGIEPLTYSPSAAAHPEVAEFLATLAELIRQRSNTQEYFAAGQ